MLRVSHHLRGGLLPTRALVALTGVSSSQRCYSQKPSQQETFDVCVIGCGPAGFAATMRAYDLKKRVCVVEKAKVGGTGLHNGALSSKALWEVSRQYKDTYKFLHCFQAPPGDDRNRYCCCFSLFSSPPSCCLPPALCCSALEGEG